MVICEARAYYATSTDRTAIFEVFCGRCDSSDKECSILEPSETLPGFPLLQQKFALNHLIHVERQFSDHATTCTLYHTVTIDSALGEIRALLVNRTFLQQANASWPEGGTYWQIFRRPWACTSPRIFEGVLRVTSRNRGVSLEKRFRMLRDSDQCGGMAECQTFFKQAPGRKANNQTKVEKGLATMGIEVITSALQLST